MKKITMQFCLLAIVSMGIGCSGNGSSSTSDTTSSTMKDTSMRSNSMGDNTKMNNNMADTGMKAPAMAGDDKDDKTFVMEVANGGMTEVEMGKLTATNAASSKVKDFGKMMVADHTKANNELKGIAGKKNITVPAMPDEKSQQHIADMKKMKGADFDKSYVDMMINDHKETISKFENEASNGKDADIKSFAGKTLPTLKQHLQEILAVQASMK